MNTKEQPTVLPWHYDAAREINSRLNTTHYVDLASLIARHDPAPLTLVEKKIAYLQAEHAETLRLLEDIDRLCNHGIPFYAYADSEAGCDLARRLDEIRALAAQGGGK